MVSSVEPARYGNEHVYPWMEEYELVARDWDAASDGDLCRLDLSVAVPCDVPYWVKDEVQARLEERFGVPRWRINCPLVSIEFVSPVPGPIQPRLFW